MDFCRGNVTCRTLVGDGDAVIPSAFSPADFNDTMDTAWCVDQFATETAFLTRFLQDTGELFCEAGWHIATCWPPARADELATGECPTDFGGSTFTYNANASATRQCFPNGTWSTFDNYSDCMANRIEEADGLGNQHRIILHHLTTFLHYFGYSLSFASCLLAIAIYTRFRSLCRLRNVIHLNLIATYIVSAVAWVAMHSIRTPEEGIQEITNEIRGMIVAFTYGQLATFFWALCEGIYMTCILFRPHKLEQMTYLPFGLLGWIFPAIITAIWTSIKFTFDVNGDWFRITNMYNLLIGIPSLAVLAINLILLIISLYTILRRHHVPSRNGTSIVGRGVRSFLILMPLLGLTYVTILVLPTKPSIPRYILQTLSAVLLPTQGFCVSVLYCFCNRQVRGLLKFHCYHKLAWMACRNSSDGEDDYDLDNGNPKDRDFSSTRQSVNNRSINPKKFNGNTNELQYILKAQKTHGKFRPGLMMDPRTESLRISGKSNTCSRSKMMPIVAI